jgi:hypothetical protein
MEQTVTGRVAKSGVQPPQVLAFLVGAFFVVLGVVGFIRTGFNDFAGDGRMLWGFMVNPLHNLVHLAVGVLGLVLAMRSGSARLYGWILLVAYGLVFVWGLMITGVLSHNPVSGLGNPLRLTNPDNWLHGVSALVGLIIAILPARRTIVTEAPATTAAPVATTDRDRVDERGRVDRGGRVEDPATGPLIGTAGGAAATGETTRGPVAPSSAAGTEQYQQPAGTGYPTGAGYPAGQYPEGQYPQGQYPGAAPESGGHAVTPEARREDETLRHDAKHKR